MSWMSARDAQREKPWDFTNRLGPAGKRIRLQHDMDHDNATCTTVTHVWQCMFKFTFDGGQSNVAANYNFQLSKLLYLPQFISCVTSILAIVITYTLNYNSRWGDKISIVIQGAYFFYVLSAVVSRITCVSRSR